MGITGRDLSVDSMADIKEVLSLGFAKSSFYYAVPENSTLVPKGLNGKVIATSYPNLVELDLEKKGVKADIVKLDGAIEISIRMGVADAIADVVQTGRTMKEAGLKITGSPVMESEAILVSGKNNSIDDTASRTFIDRMRGIVVARNYVMLEYDIPEERLEDACFISPGIEAPTISPLSKKGWHAVKSMTKKKHVNSIMDELYDVGAKGIIVTEIKNSRL
jgi:ATP phosphoribosyltransferase